MDKVAIYKQMTDQDAYTLRHLGENLGLSKSEVLLVASSFLGEGVVSTFDENEKIYEWRSNTIERLRHLCFIYGVKKQQAIYCSLMFFSRHYFEDVHVNEFRDIVEDVNDKSKTSKDFEDLAHAKALELGRFYDLSVKTIVNLAIAVTFMNCNRDTVREVEGKSKQKTFKNNGLNRYILEKIDDVGLLLEKFIRKIKGK